jgi:hypothetical protein
MRRWVTDRCGVPPLLLLLTVVVAVNCQRLDPNLTGGIRIPSLSGDGPNPGMGGTGMRDAGVVAADCPNLRMQAYAVLQTNCAICHQAPGTPALYSGTFSFILNLAQLTSTTSPASSATVPLKYVVKGDADASYIYKRIVTGSMPPASRTQRPSTADKDILRQWIASCIDDPTSPEGWAGSTADAGAADAGPTLESCGATNNCPAGSCCVFNLCRPNGTTCGPLPNPIPGQTNLPGLPGMCMSGACQTTSGVPCGKVGQPCCDLQTCTDSQASCLTTDLSMCSACGGPGQPCCRPQNCLSGNACIGFGVGRVGTCEACGDVDQPCCGSGVAAQQTCNSALVCVADGVTGTHCAAGTSPAGGGDAR